MPLILIILSLISVLILKSIAPDLVVFQVLFFSLGLIIFFTVSRFEFDQIQNLAWPFYGLINLLLIIALIYGQLTDHTGRWIPILGRFNAQPSQLAIPATALVLLSLQESFNSLRGLIKALFIILIPAVLILVEPDLGTTAVYTMSVGSIIFVSRISSQKIVSLLSLVVISSILAWLLILQPYQKQRITSFVNPSQDTRGANYNARQALIAVGSGQLFGQGLGQGIQSHLRFLPEHQTDFIFAALAEEFGFIGSIIVVGLYLVLIGSIFKLAFAVKSQEAFSFCVCIAVATSVQAGVNIGMNIGLLPITGLTLPFLSYGGSSILSLSLTYGIVQSIVSRIQPQAHLHLA